MPGNGIFLKRGAHKTVDEGACAMEWLAWVAGEEHSDHPVCVSSTAASFVRRYQDALDDEPRQLLIPVLLDLIGTGCCSRDDELTRGYLCADFVCRVALPWRLRMDGFPELAAQFAGLPPVVSPIRTSDALLAVDDRIMVWSRFGLTYPNASARALLHARRSLASMLDGEAAHAAYAAAGYTDWDPSAPATFMTLSSLGIITPAANPAAGLWETKLAARALLPEALTLIRAMAAVGRRLDVETIEERYALVQAG